MSGINKFAVAGMALAVLTGCGSADSPRAGRSDTTTATTSSTTTATTSESAAPEGTSEGFADVVERVSPSVVTVRLQNGVGSGVVLKSDVVVTNAHVVGDAAEVDLEFADGEVARGTVLAVDSVTDLAVVQSQRKDLPVPEYQTDLPRPGDVAVAIGSPLGFQNSVTAGVISGLHRDIPGSAAETSSLVDLIQTDAPISPGNSGGALLDAEGRVVGINEAYIPPEVGAVSLGFAIPSGTVLDVTEQLLTTGRARHPYLGVSVGQLTPAIRQAFGVDAESGALVTAVDNGGPAAIAGLRPGDVITQVGDDPVSTVEDLLSALRRTRAGARVTVEFLRGSAEKQTSVAVGERAR
ncbi:S1C family serine protease [Mycolicibacterium mengxianglii]|uniref:S1C family serine protease n=1 Tax=Mycolicibacterium mengxianglii TaxID=2736649 RepID=UPI001E2F8095|nr:trypsin-like peptidase domain-containing protein [Mycolicibacterium mengxianglii]